MTFPYQQAPAQAPATPDVPQVPEQGGIAPNGYVPQPTPSAPQGHTYDPALAAYYASIANAGQQGGAPVPTTPITNNGVPTSPRHATNPSFQTPVETPQTPQVPTGNLYTQQELNKPTQPVVGDNYIATAVGGLISELGISEDAFDATFEAALKHGDLSLVNVASLGLDPANAARAQQLAVAAAQYVQSETKAAEARILAVAGGQEQWTAAISTFNANADANTKGYIEYLYTNGKEEEAARQVIAYVQGNGLQNTVTKAPVFGSNGVPEQGLSKEDYRRELATIDRELGNKSWSDPAVVARVEALDRRREIGRRQGI